MKEAPTPLRRGIARLGLALLLSLPLLVGADGPQGAFERHAMRAPIPEALRTEVLVLGSVHLATLDDRLTPAHLDTLLAALERFAPALIAVEALPSGTIQAMLDREKTFGPVLESTRKPGELNQTVTLGRAAQEALKMTPDAARGELHGLLEDFAADPDAIVAERRREAALLALAGFELPTAMLQWRYLAPVERRAAGGMPASVAEALSERVAGTKDELNAIGVRLAHRLGHQRIAAIDDHMDKDELLPLVPSLEELLGASPRAKGLQESAPYSELRSRQQAALQAGDLLPLYRWLNSDVFVGGDVAGQFHLFFELDDSALARRRSALWEVRNLNMASNVRRATAELGARRAVIVVGVGHKAFLEAYLERMMDVETVSFDDALAPLRPPEM